MSGTSKVSTWRQGGVSHVVVPLDDWERLLNRLEDAEDRLALLAHESVDERDLIPLDVAKAIAKGSSPLAAWRAHRGLTQKSLAKLAGVTQATVSQLEKGERQGTAKVLSRLASALDTNVDSLIPMDGL